MSIREGDNRLARMLLEEQHFVYIVPNSDGDGKCQIEEQLVPASKNQRCHELIHPFQLLDLEHGAEMGQEPLWLFVHGCGLGVSG